MGNSHKLVLYTDANFASPYALSVFVALHEKKLRFEISTINLAAKANDEPSYAGASLTHRVPTLVHNGFALSESSAIDEYIDEVFDGTPLYPSGAQHCARARQIQAWLRSDLMPIRDERSTTVMFFAPVKSPLSVAAQSAAAKLFAFADALLPAKAENLFGEWCIADTDLAVMLNRLVMNGDPVPERLAAYAKRQWQRPPVQLWVNQKRPP